MHACPHQQGAIRAIVVTLDVEDIFDGLSHCAVIALANGLRDRGGVERGMVSLDSFVSI